MTAEPTIRTGERCQPFVRCGIDVVAIDRIEALRTEFQDTFTRRVFTDAEREYCDGNARPAEHYAARWAAKEAFVKVLRDPDSTVPPDSIGVRRTASGPSLWLDERAETALERLLAEASVDPSRAETSLSLAHDRASGCAIAQVLLFGITTDD